MAPHILLRDREMAVPNSPEHNSNTMNQATHCSRACNIALATVLPIIAIIIILTIIYFAWYVPKQAQRRRQQADEERIRKKLGGEEESMASSDVSSLDGQVHGLNEEREHEEGRRESRVQMGTQTQGRKVEEGHEHDHVLAMITARP
ncbi:MAG: hypothetical protein Q9218_001875 [Villophora microphyllina]